MHVYGRYILTHAHERRYTIRKYEYYINRMASRIQLWFRLRRLSMLGRAFRQQLKTCATKIQACVVGHLARKYTQQLRKHKMATRLQVWFIVS